MARNDIDLDEGKLYALIGERVKRHRIRRGKTQSWLAQRVGLLRTSITNIENGRQKPPLHIVYALCDALAVDPLEILPTAAEVRRLDHEQVAIAQDRVEQLPPKTAKFVRGVIDDATRRPK